jgi:polyisoprenoid-binding protein YceI
MKKNVRSTLRHKLILPTMLLLLLGSAAAQDLLLQPDLSRSSVKFTLGAALHSVHGSFRMKSGSVRASSNPAKISGEIIVDSKSGETGNGMRDRKMHQEVLESDRFPEITFRPEHVDGSLAVHGASSLNLRGVFRVHGSDHEITFPAEVEIDGNLWHASANFTIPYAKWGIKNPSTFFLHVSDEVQIEINLTGTLTIEGRTNSPAQ